MDCSRSVAGSCVSVGQHGADSAPPAQGVLAVRTGTPLLFVNNDSVAHQVYSFAPSKRFELALYHGQPVSLDRPGIYSISASAINSWMGEEFHTIGVETSLAAPIHGPLRPRENRNCAGCAVLRQLPASATERLLQIVARYTF
ncbi:hypothetical protein [Steroidobacter cummioxidans]|uniref:hypothetical protein n=1 Tax=Steroidobacter cummioxidans TaxID=1803913 RepID=UPI000E30CA00|nr:hypothetical protein [Steroidobacter cummioxidans]